MYNFVATLYRLLIRNRRLRDALILFLLTGFLIWGIAIHEYLTEEVMYSFNKTVYVVYLTIAMFIIPITLTSNLFSFVFSLIRFSILFSNYTVRQVVKNLVVFFALSNLIYDLLFFAPLFFVNSEIEELFALAFLSTGIGVPLSILISSTKIKSIDLTKAKTHNYEGLSFKIIFLTISMVATCFGIIYFMSDKYITPFFVGILGLLILPLWIKIIKNRLLVIEDKFKL